MCQAITSTDGDPDPRHEKASITEIIPSVSLHESYCKDSGIAYGIII